MDNHYQLMKMDVSINHLVNFLINVFVKEIGVVIHVKNVKNHFMDLIVIKFLKIKNVF